MKHPLYIYYSIGIAFALTACSPSGSQRTEGLQDKEITGTTAVPDTETTIVQDIDLEPVYFRYPYRIEIRDSLAMILDLHNDSHYLYAFTYPDWRPIAPFGRRGEGPEELLSADRVRLCAPDSVWVLDANRMQITRWAIDATAKQVTRVETVSLDKRLLRTLDFCKTPDGFLVDDYTGKYRYHVLGPDGQIRRSVGTVPTRHEELLENAPALAQAWRSFIFMLRAVCRPVLSAFLLHASICALSLRSSRSADGVALQPCKVMKKSCSAFRLSDTSPSLKNSVMRASSSSDVWPS